jgi:hypothetical protein
VTNAEVRRMVAGLQLDPVCPFPPEIIFGLLAEARRRGGANEGLVDQMLEAALYALCRPQVLAAFDPSNGTLADYALMIGKLAMFEAGIVPGAQAPSTRVEADFTEEVENRETLEVLPLALAQLTPYDEKVLTLCYGLHGSTPHNSDRQLGAALGFGGHNTAKKRRLAAEKALRRVMVDDHPGIPGLTENEGAEPFPPPRRTTAIPLAVATAS